MRIIFLSPKWDHPDFAGQQAVRIGLERLGHRVEAVGAVIRKSHLLSPPGAVFVWNGIHGSRGRSVLRLRNAGVPVFVMERGFFDRVRYTQIDHKGFNHRASWADDLLMPTPPEASSRLERVWGEVLPMRARRNGYVLVLLQVPCDAQLRDSEIHYPEPLVKAVATFGIAT